MRFGGCLFWWMDGWIIEWMDGRVSVGGCLDGWMNGWMGEFWWMGGYTCFGG